MKFDICGSMHTCVRGNAHMYPPPHRNMHACECTSQYKICSVIKCNKNSDAHEYMEGIVWITEISLYVRLLEWRMQR